MVGERPPRPIDWSQTTWEGSRRELIARWARMSLDEILEAQEEMADLAQELAAGGAEAPAAPGGEDGQLPLRRPDP